MPSRVKSVFARGLKLSSRDSEIPNLASLMMVGEKRCSHCVARLLFRRLNKIAEIRTAGDAEPIRDVGGVPRQRSCRFE